MVKNADLVVQHLGYIRTLVRLAIKKIGRESEEDADNFFGEAVLACLKLAPDFDNTRTFRSFIRKRVIGSVLDAKRAEKIGFGPREKRVSVLRFSNYDLDKLKAPDETTYSAAGRVLERALRMLKENHKAVLVHKYFNGQKQKDIAKMLGVNEPRICQLEKAALQKMREELNKMGVTSADDVY